MDKAGALERIKLLVEKYNQKEASGEIKHFSESQVKKDFIEPLFEALGWNTRDSSEVSAEENIAGKRADYGFRINGITKFYLEAKSPKIDLNNPDFIKQAVNYSYYKSCTWAVLTNFKELRVYNAEIRSNSPLEIELFPTIPFSEYVEKIDQLMLLSKESFEQGLTDKEAEKWSKKARKIPIDKQLLEDFTHFRELLSKDITKLNHSKNLSQDDLDEAVQRILDRLIFIRNCEDRQLEPTELKSNYRTWESKGKGQLINSLRARFKEYDSKYNSELFKEHLCDQIDVDNEALSEIISGLYNTKDMIILYDFSNIPADVLGNIYEQYLGHILRKTDKRATLKENHAHRKEQGIYYTPTYVVDYIVKNTIGELIKDPKTDLKKIKVLDPACGSGSFLIRAYDRLYDEYKSRIKDSHTEVIKEDILRDNIFGVDLDKQAVEIAQLNLLLKIAQKGHKLPLLRGNIKNGNSLIDDPIIARNTAFKWEEQFKQIMDAGGFDVVIGNPPYVRPHKISITEKEFFWKNFKSYKAKSDLYACFVEKGINLLKDEGLFSFILPHTWTSLESFYDLRKYILDNCRVIKLVQLPKKVFQDATVETTIFVLQKETDELKRENNLIVVESLSQNGKVEFIKQFKQGQIKSNHLSNFELYTEASGNQLLEKIKNKGNRLGDLVTFFYGLKTGDDDKFISNSQKNSEYKRLLRSKDISRFSKKFQGEYVWYVPELMIKNKETARPGDKDRFESEKIIVARMGKQVVAAYDDERYYVKDGMLLLKKSDSTNLRYITGILNSKVVNYYYKNYFITIDVLKNALLELPIALGDVESSSKICSLVERAEKIAQDISIMGDKKTDERFHLEEEIAKTDAEIDNMVYKIYGITDEERNVIEESLK